MRKTKWVDLFILFSVSSKFFISEFVSFRVATLKAVVCALEELGMFFNFIP